MPIAVYCCVRPTALLADAGVTWIETSAAAVTVRLAVLEFTPLNEAVMFDDPTATFVARPVALTVAFVGSLEFHATDAVMSGVLASV